MLHSDHAPEMESEFIRLPEDHRGDPDLRLHYRRVGTDGPTVLLLHGWPQTGLAWRQIMPTLAASGYTAVAPDLRGSGGSDKPSGGYDAATRMEDMRALLAALELSDAPVFVVGHGDGGVSAAQAYAHAHPAEVAALAVLSAPPVRTDDGPFTGDWLTGFHRTPDLPEALLGTQIAPYLRHFFRAWAHDPTSLSEEAIAAYIRALGEPGALRAALAPFRTASEDQAYFQGQPRNITTPSLLLLGESDSRRPAEMVQAEWRRVCPAIRTVMISRGGYWLPEERPDPVAAALLTFFGEVQP